MLQYVVEISCPTLARRKIIVIYWSVVKWRFIHRGDLEIIYFASDAGASKIIVRGSPRCIKRLYADQYLILFLFGNIFILRKYGNECFIKNLCGKIYDKYKEIYNENKRNKENILTKSNKKTKIITKPNDKLSSHENKNKQMITLATKQQQTHTQKTPFVFSSLFFKFKLPFVFCKLISTNSIVADVHLNLLLSWEET